MTNAHTPGGETMGQRASRRMVRVWLTVVAIVGLSAGAAAAGLLWMVLTRPVALAQVVSSIR